MKLLTFLAENHNFEWVWIPFNLSGECKTHYSAGECIFEWVWIPFTLSGAHESVHWPSWKLHIRMGLNPVQFKCRVWKLSTQLANAFSNGFESRSCLVERRKLSTDQADNYIFEWVWIPFSLIGECKTHHSTGECIFQRVWIPFMLSGANETLQWPRWKLQLRMGLNPLQFRWSVKLTTQLANAFANGFESRSC